MQVIILTKSSKFQAYCVVGLDYKTKKLVRLITSNRNKDGAVSQKNMICSNGDIADIFDLVEVKIIKHIPGIHQTENYLIDEYVKWKKLGTCTLSDFLYFYKPVFETSIFGSRLPYSYDYELVAYNRSISVIEAWNITLHVEISTRTGHKKTKASFRHNGVDYYGFSVTDPNMFEKKITIKRGVMIISISDRPYNDIFYYKFIAKIFEL